MSAEKRFIMGNKSKYIQKKKKNKIVKKEPVEKPFCPRLMKRYDGYDNNVYDYTMLWRCMVCNKVCCAEITATRHSIACRKKSAEIRKKLSIKPPPTPE